jgi:membrane protease YdiL (CAAX protease family)
MATEDGSDTSPIRETTPERSTRFTNLTEPIRPPHWARSPWVRLIIMFIILFAGLVLAQGIRAGTTGANVNLGLPVSLVCAAVMVWVYLLLTRWLERRRRPGELAPRQAIAFLWGALLGLVMVSAVIGVLALIGNYHVTGAGLSAGFLAGVAVHVLAGINEELLFRGAIFRIVEEALGSWAGLVISAVLFGATHLLNPGATLWDTTAIMIEAGVLFGAVYAATRNLWWCIGLHFAWDVTEANIFGIVNGGTAQPGISILTSHFTGPSILNGDDILGLDGSIVTIVICLIPAVIFLVIAHRRGRLTGWRRRPSTQA